MHLRRSPPLLRIRAVLFQSMRKQWESHSWLVEVDKRLWFSVGELIYLLADHLVLSKIIFKAATAVVCFYCKVVALDYKTLNCSCQ